MTSKVQAPALNCKYHTANRILSRPYKILRHVRGLHTQSGNHRVKRRDTYPFQYAWNNERTWRSARRASSSTAIIISRQTLKLDKSKHANDRFISSRIIGDANRRVIRKVIQKRRGRRRQVPKQPPFFVRLGSLKVVRSDVEREVVRTSGTLESYSSRWTTALAQTRDLHSSKNATSLKEKSGSISTFSKHRSYPTESKDSTKSWIASTRRHKLKTWETRLIVTLRESPSDVLKILRKNLQSSGTFLPGHVVEDCLDHVVWLYLNSKSCPNRELFYHIHSIACEYLEVYGQKFNSVSLHQRVIRLLSMHCNVDQLVLLLEKLSMNTAFIHTNTRLHLMAKLVEYGRIGLALSLLKGMPSKDLSLDKVQMFCVVLLRAELGVEDLYSLRSNILAFMLEAGVRPNRFLADIIILNAMEAGDLNTAWSSHEIAKENGLEPDAVTYTALLKGIQHGDAKHAVQLVYKEAKLDGCLASSSRLKFELLYAIYLSNSGKYHDKPYSILLPYYREFFDITPLQELGIFHSPQGDIENGDQHTEPPVQALGLILLAWLTENHHNGPVLAVYRRYLYHIRHDNSLIAQLAQTDHTANAFVVAFGQSPRSIHMCTQVVQDMLKAQVVKTDASRFFPIKPSASDPGMDATEDPAENHNGELVDWEAGSTRSAGTPFRNAKDYKVPQIAPPTVQTWNILLFAFIKNRQLDAAEKVLVLMEARGQKPDSVTWTSLLSGYAHMQDFPGVVHTLNRIDRSGFEQDEWTTKALARVVDRDSLLRTFENSRKGEGVKLAVGQGLG